MDILIVEDNKELLTLLTDFLRAEGYTVSIAENGEKALSLYEKYGARLVLLDINLPGMDGFAAHTTGSLTPTFVSARPVGLAVRLAYAFALYCLVSVQAEPTFERLRYSLGGDRPSQTAHLTMSPDQFHGRRLEFQYHKCGIPTSTPLRLTP